MTNNLASRLSTSRVFTRRAALWAGALAMCVGAAAPSAWAQSYPNRPIKLIAPYPAGGGVDAVARLIGERLATRLGQPIVVDNKPGAAATIGGDALAKSAPDGYTLMVGSITDYAIAPHVHKNLSFDVRKDFAPIVEMGYGTVILVVSADFPPRNVKDLIALAKSKPGELSFASSGIGGLQHLNGEMFKQMAGIDLVHVPYKGTTQLLPDLLAGRVPMAIDSLPAHLPHIKSGKVRVLAVASATRAATLPDVPTMAEAGLPGYESATNYTLFAPAGTPKDIVALLNKETNAILQMPDVREKLQAQGIVITGGSVEAVERRIPREVDKWTKVVKASHLKFD
jgi:tripartite-type tricarboxylate transporter receptor subunit TctC